MNRLVDDALFKRMVARRRDLHQHPELAFKEHRTSARVIEGLDELGIAHRRVTETGVVGELPGPRGVPWVALRADMDALPIKEETGLPFASLTDGVMHACGHDGHTSMLLGAAELLSRQDSLPAPVRLVFQPAEERGAGAKAMVEAGALQDVAAIFGGHLDRHFHTGELAITEGVVNAATDRFVIDIRGKGGHGGRPHEAVDAVVVASLLVMAIQTIVSREIDPTYPSVVSVGRFDAGTVANAIAEHAHLEGTIRSQHDQVGVHLRRSVRRIAKSIGKLHGARVDVDLEEGLPRVENGAEMTALARMAGRAVVGDVGVRALEHANMGAEDFSRYLQETPGCYIRVGSQVPGREGYPAHSSRFDFDEDAMAYGAAWFAEIALHAGRAVANGELHEAPPA